MSLISCLCLYFSQLTWKRNFQFLSLNANEVFEKSLFTATQLAKMCMRATYIVYVVPLKTFIYGSPVLFRFYISNYILNVNYKGT